MRILVVEDNAEVRTFVETTLRQEGHDPRAVATRAEAEEALREGSFAGAVLDWMLPDGSGVELCRAMRQAGDETPILMLTARGDVEDRVAGLDAGADDYLKKPFAAAELRARVRALLRRGPRLTDPIVRIGPVTIEFAAHRATSPKGEIVLTAREFAILEELARARGRVLPRSSLLLSVWGVDDAAASGSLEVLIARLRRKLATAGAPDAIRTMRGVGYSLRGEP
jgi:two-component system OmpR family response regulator